MFAKFSSSAVVPQRQHATDVGLDITVIGVDEERASNKISYWRTGLAVQPPEGYYFELHVRSSLHKTGWTLSNNVGIIDPEYRGEIIMAMTQLFPDAKLPEFPFRAGQLILRKVENEFKIKEVTFEELSITKRGKGGFGSTGK
jgi:dUTP pyrophosphatase